MKTWIISDTHTFHNQLNIPKVDCVIHCGDFANKANPYENELEARNFLEWYNVLPIQYKILNCGNHDTAAFKKLIDKADYPNIIWLEHDWEWINGYKVFVSPYTPVYGKGWAYMYKRNRGDIYWNVIPNDIDILVTHGPPKGILDLCDHEADRKQIAQAGCKALYNKVMEIEPKIHCFGHIHNDKKFNNYGIFEHGNTKFINAACLNHRSMKLNLGHIVEI